MSSKIKSNNHILFQGDSITDCGRVSCSDGLGSGYVSIIRAMLQVHHPELNLRISNRGVAGDRTVELLNRWAPDCEMIRPDVLSIKIGIADVWRLRGMWNDQKFVSITDYEINYRMLIERAIKSGIQTLVLVSSTTIAEENDSELSRHLDERADCVKKLSKEYDTYYVPARETFVQALKTSRDVRWTTDGCHPTVAGHALIAATWLKTTQLL